MKVKTRRFAAITLIIFIFITFTSVFSEKSEDKASEDTKKTETTEKSSSKSSDNDSEKEIDKKNDNDSDKDSEKSDNSSKSSDKNTFPKPRADAAVIVDANSGDVIYAMESDKKLFPAGTSNIMTAIIALENAKLGDSFMVTAEALANVKYDQPQLGMKEGEAYTLEQLLYAILLNSDNDAANTIAIGIAGSIDGFVEKMNEKAEQMELSGTHFANPTGLQNENHYTTAYDLAVMARQAMRIADFREIVKTPKYEMSTPHGNETLLSTNHLVSRYKYPYHYYSNAIGIKSGNSKDAGYCLVAGAEKDGLSVISVVLGCDNADAKDGAYSFIDTTKMLNYIFENYKSVLLTKKGDIVYDSKVSEAKDSTRVAMTTDSDIYITMKNTADADAITSEVKIIQDLKAPIHQGDYFGTITYSYNGKEIKTANVVAANEVKRDFLAHIFMSLFHFIFNPIVFLIIVVAVAFWARVTYVRNKKRQIRRKKLVSQNGTRTQTGASKMRRTPTTRSRSFDRYKR